MRSDNNLLAEVERRNRIPVGQIIAGGLLIWALILIFGIPL